MVAEVPVSVSYVPLPSRSQTYLAIEPSLSFEPLPLRVTVAPVKAGLGAAVNEASGGLLGIERAYWLATSAALRVRPNSATSSRSPVPNSPLAARDMK